MTRYKVPFVVYRFLFATGKLVTSCTFIKRTLLLKVLEALPSLKGENAVTITLLSLDKTGNL